MDCNIFIIEFYNKEGDKKTPSPHEWGVRGVESVADTFLLYRKFLKSSEIVYNRLEIKNDITKERRGLRHDVVYEVFCFGLG